MLRHVGLMWFRMLASNRLLSAISISGLVVGLAAAILMTAIVREPLGYNAQIREAGGPTSPFPSSPAKAWSRATRKRARPPPPRSPGSTCPMSKRSRALPKPKSSCGRAARFAARRSIGPTPISSSSCPSAPVAGDLSRALAGGDGIVMRRGDAVRWFGRDNPLGRTIEVGGRPMRVRAILPDVRTSRTDLASGIFVSGQGAQSPLGRSAGDEEGSFSIGARTYLRLRAGASPQAVEEGLERLIQPMLPPPLRGGAYRMELVRIDRIALHEGLHPGMLQRLAAGSVVAALILFIAAANFVNLSLGMGARRGREIAVRKANGASRLEVAVHFLGEAVLTVLTAALLALAAAEWLLPPLNLYLGTEAVLDYVAEPQLPALLFGGALILGVVAGSYPALVLSSLRPAASLKGESGRSGSRVRSVLVTAQFAILIGLVIATAVVREQRAFAMDEALRVDVDQVVTITAPCPRALTTELARLPGVRGVSCSGREMFGGEVFAFVDVRGQRVAHDIVSTLPATFALYGVEPIAGSLESLPAQGEEATSRVVVNEAAARHIAIGSPAAAVGQIVNVPPFVPGPAIRAQVVAVVPDFAFHSVEMQIAPTIYLDRPTGPDGEGLVSVKLAGNRIPETLREIDRLWRATGNEGPIERSFVAERIEALYQDLARATQLFALFSAIALFLAGIGIVGLSLSMAERRRKEIAIRKALGATTADILKLLLWQFSRPVLLANLIAWPIAWWLMQRWLRGFAQRVELDLWLFPASGLVALFVALLSVGALAAGVARRPPIEALRHD
jgi:putative ABC transport system permease protein